MTTDIELLPLPPLYIAPSVEPVDYPNVAQALMDYARANVAHATAAKDAEIERLRALLLEACDDGDEADADLLATLERARTAEARAERLAEALREITHRMPKQAGPAWIAKSIAQSALRDHDQEVDNG